MLGISHQAWKRIIGYRAIAIASAFAISSIFVSIAAALTISVATELVHTCLHYGVERTCKDNGSISTKSRKI